MTKDATPDRVRRFCLWCKSLIPKGGCSCWNDPEGKSTDTDPPCPYCGMTSQVEPSRSEPGRWMCHGCAEVFDTTSESGPKAPTGHSLDTPSSAARGVLGDPDERAGREAIRKDALPPGRALNPCVPVQDAAEEAARSSSDHTDMADEQAGTRALPLCHHGYYASRCPTCQDRRTA